MKKATAVLLALILAVLTLSPTLAFDGKRNDYPVILVPGYSGSQLIMTNDDGSEEQVWYIDFHEVLEVVKQKIPNILLGATLLTAGQKEYLVKLLEPEVNAFLEKLACNDDGSSKYNIRAKLDATAEAALWKNLDEDDLAFADHFGEDVDPDNFFVFGCDFRMDAKDNAERLGQLIDSVLEYTGKDRVNIFAQSYGGQITGTYLSLDPDHAGEKVNNAVMCVPALGGATIAYDFLNESIDFDEHELVDYLEYGFFNETDFHLLLGTDPDIFVDLLFEAAYPMLKNIVGNWLSLWDFLPYDEYKEVIDNQLDPVANAALIEKTTAFHEEFMAKFTENLNRAKASGVNISIIAGSGHASVGGMQENSDAIIPVKGSTGALCAPFGQRFSDGYAGKGTVCSNPAHNHVSPSMEVDLSVGYLPENTWLIDGYYHGMERMDDFIETLFKKQLLSDEPLKSVHDDPAYPQFHTAASDALTVHARFNNSPEGYISSSDTELIITNNSKSDVIINDISSAGMSLSFPAFIPVASGEIKSVAFTGSVPKISRARASLTLSYTIVGTSSFTPVGQRTLPFTLMNGPSPEFNESSPYAELTQTYDVEAAVGSHFGKILDRFKLTSTADSFYKLITRIIESIKGLVRLFKGV